MESAASCACTCTAACTKALGAVRASRSQPFIASAFSSSFLSLPLLMRERPRWGAFGGGGCVMFHPGPASAAGLPVFYLSRLIKTPVSATIIRRKVTFCQRRTCCLLLINKGGGINGTVSMATRHLANISIIASSLSARPHASISGPMRPQR